MTPQEQEEKRGEARVDEEVAFRKNMGLPEPLSCEDPDNGLYVRQRDKHGNGTFVLTLPQPDGDPRQYVPVEDFMAIQKERDEHRKVVGLINAWRREPDRREATLRKLLAAVGLGDGDADAMRQLVTQFGGDPR